MQSDTPLYPDKINSVGINIYLFIYFSVQFNKRGSHSTLIVNLYFHILTD